MGTALTTGNISQQVGNENIYFGQTSGQVIHRYAAGDYNPADWYEGDPNLRRAIDFLIPAPKCWPPARKKTVPFAA